MNNEELVQLYQNGDNKALDKLIQANTGIIKKIAIKYNGINRELEFDDLFQNGVLGLIAAAKKYKLEGKDIFITCKIYLVYSDWYLIISNGEEKFIAKNKIEIIRKIKGFN